MTWLITKDFKCVNLNNVAWIRIFRGDESNSITCACLNDKEITLIEFEGASTYPKAHHALTGIIEMLKLTDLEVIYLEDILENFTFLETL